MSEADPSGEPAQHRTPCAACPFSRGVKPGALSGSGTMTYVGQVNGSFRLPCHVTHDYKSLEARLAAQVHCAGAAIFRSNVGVADKIHESLLHLPADREKVFASFAEFVAHHERLPLALAERMVADITPDELTRAQVEIALEKARAGTATVKLFEKK